MGSTGTRTLFSIECESGKEIHQHSYFQQENEILLLPATQFEVLGKINPAPGFYIIHLKEITPSFPLLQSPCSHPISHSTPEPYCNENLETLIQQKVTLVFAEFRESQLNDEDAHLIAKELAKNTVWQSISLTENNIRTAGMTSLSTSLQLNSTLQTLRLTYNQLEDDGITCLAAALKVNKTLEELYVGNNKISDAGAKHIAKMLKVNQSLKQISLQGNEIGDSGMAALADSLLLNTTLKSINMSVNKITDQSINTIVDIPLHTKSLYYLRLSKNKFSADAKVKLNPVIEQNKTCVYLQ